MPKDVQHGETLPPEFFSKDGIFGLEPLKAFRPNAWLTHAQFCGNHAVIATVKNTLIRFSCSQPTKMTEIEISRSTDDRVHNLFLDPMGWHTIISMQSGANFYTNRNMKKVRPLMKARDLLVDSVGWHPNNTSEVSTQEILLGTNDGVIFETVLLSDEGRLISNTPEQYWKQVADLGYSVTGIQIIHPTRNATTATGSEAQRCIIVATTPSRMHQFAGWMNSTGTTGFLSHLTGGNSPPRSRSSSVASNMQSYPSETPALVGSTPSGGSFFPSHSPGLYQNVFSPEDKLPAGSKVTEFPKSFGYSDLKVYQVTGEEMPSTFAWMTGSGIFFGNFNTSMLRLPPFTLLPSMSSTTQDPSRNPTTESTNGTLVEEPGSTDVKQIEDVFSGRVIHFTQDTKLLTYPIIRMLEHTSSPLGICLTAYHVIVAYADRVKAINVLDDQTVYSMPLSSELGVGSALNICRDQVTGSIWLGGSQGVARLNINNEAVRIWKIYLDRSQFDKARKACQNESQLDAVTIQEAETCFACGDYMKSAELFARTSIPFEEAALKFSHLSTNQPRPLLGFSPVLQGMAVTTDHDVMDSILHATELEPVVKSTNLDRVKSNDLSTSDPLKAFISSKLDQLLSESRKFGRSTRGAFCSDKFDQGKMALLVLWLAKVQLTEIGFLKDSCHNPTACDNPGKLERLRQEFKQLLTQPEVLTMLPQAKELLYGICESHGNDDELIFVAELSGDFDRLVDHHMRLGSVDLALQILSSQPVCSACMYTHATTLVLKRPEATVNTWIRLGRRLDPLQLLPAVMLLPSKEAMRYLRHVVERYSPVDQAVHHLLISLCAEASAQHKDALDSTNDPLMDYLESTSSQAFNMTHLDGHEQLAFSDRALVSDGSVLELDETAELSRQLNSLVLPKQDTQFIQSALPYDPGFVLRTCKESGHLRGTVFVLKLLGLHKQALQAAIDQNHIALAKEIAQDELLSQDERRQLWIILARHLIGKKNSIQEATNLLRECSLLKLEDILPYFPDFVTVDQFKDAICASLDSYHQRIEEVKHEMHAVMRSSDALRKQLDGLRSRHVLLNTDTRCTRCNYVLLSRSFYLFPCGHNFHTDCLVQLVLPQVNEEKRAEILGLLGKPIPDASVQIVDIQGELDRLIASDCAVCGEIAIAAVGDLFFTDQSSYDSHLAIWQ